ncbi:MAG TPA: nucleoside hydrolase [Aggregatilineaceae bacterium]|jgi:inosine-uridine nucleoside N-ribohydrolase|nr:nucleoside hydrolase [Aggregatilineaceae bacterium]
MTQKVLLDTDIGTDIDDAVCLAYLLAQPECDLLGITTVTGEAHRRAMLASALCAAAGRTVPVFPGVEGPLLIPQRQRYAPQADALARWDHETRFLDGEAINFLRRTIRAHPGQVTLLAIGPLTNIALLFALDPEIPTLLQRLVLMGGYYANRLAGIGSCEHNFLCDPHAAARVFMSPVMIAAVGLEVTSQLQMDAREVRARFAADLLRPVLDFAEVWFREREEIVFHDPLAATVIFDEPICTFERGHVEIELANERLRGFSHWTPDGPEARHAVAVTVDSARFFEHFFGVFR